MGVERKYRLPDERGVSGGGGSKTLTAARKKVGVANFSEDLGVVDVNGGVDCGGPSD